MDKVLLDDLINTVNCDIENSNTYEGLDVLMSSLSDDEVKYFVEGCGEKIFFSDTLTSIMWNTRPLIFYDYVCSFIDEKLIQIDEYLITLNHERSKDIIGEKEFKRRVNGVLGQKNQLLLLKNGFVSNIVHFMSSKNKK